MKRKITAIAFMLLCVCSVAFAQDRDQSVYLEAMGPSNMLGVSYDARIKPESSIGYRIGIAYSGSITKSFFGGKHDQNSVSIPLELNYLVGKGKNKLEMGVGTSLGMYHNSGDYWTGNSEETFKKEHYSETTFGYYLYGNIGYRRISKSGFQFRCGVSPSFNLGDKHGVKKNLFYPYVSVGYAF